MVASRAAPDCSRFEPARVVGEGFILTRQNGFGHPPLFPLRGGDGDDRKQAACAAKGGGGKTGEETRQAERLPYNSETAATGTVALQFGDGCAA